jgi:hypothetical protein
MPAQSCVAADGRDGEFGRAGAFGMLAGVRLWRAAEEGLETYAREVNFLG